MSSARTKYLFIARYLQRIATKDLGAYKIIYVSQPRDQRVAPNDFDSIDDLN